VSAPPRDPPRTVEDALARAAAHGRAAAGESALALRALLDAASLAASGAPAERHALLRRAARGLEALAAAAGGDEGRWLAAMAEALDAEIARWEARSHEDDEARAVLRAFLGLRELLWELGLRRARPGPAAAAAPRARPTRTRPVRRSGSARLERVRVDADRPGPAPG
jgi:hypothetical protein